MEKGISHELQINLDMVISMNCADLHVNVQDASGDRILAGDMLNKDGTVSHQWVDGSKGVYLLESGALSKEIEEDTHVGHVLGELKSAKRKFPKTPKLPRGEQPNACRIYGSLEGNKVQGDFHITARGHGYQEFGQHLDHSGMSYSFLLLCLECVTTLELWLMSSLTLAFNFSHAINELSFGPFYPSLQNPLDRTFAIATANFWRYQYYLSIVPTVYTRSPNPDPSNPSSSTVFTNQYAVTSQSHEVSDHTIPGIFFKFDIEPILLMIREERGSFMALIVRMVNVISGILVGGGWCYQIFVWSREIMAGRKRSKSVGMIHGNGHVEEDE